MNQIEILKMNELNASNCKPTNEENNAAVQGVSRLYLLSMLASRRRSVLFAHWLAIGCILKKDRKASGDWKRMYVCMYVCRLIQDTDWAQAE